MGARHEADVVILGVGTCGEDLSLRLIDAGLEVVGIEAALVGGECPYYACLPSKMMARAGNLLQEARRVDGMAGRAEVTPDWGPVAARVRAEATGGWDDSVAVARFEQRGGRLIHGLGEVVGARDVRVGELDVTARRGLVIATGSKPAIPPIPGLSEVPYWTTRDLIQAAALPESLLVLGGGAVGCELGQVWARFGVTVTIVEASDRLLPAEEPESSDAITTTLEAEGVKVFTGAPAEQVAADAGVITIALRGGGEVSAERLLVATGRTVDVSDLGLSAAGVELDGRFIAVDERLRAADGVWAMGDVTGKAMFTHVALYQSAIVAADILGAPHPAASYHAVPRVTFTDPEVAAVGMTEHQATSAGIDVLTVVKRLPATFRGWLHGATDGVTKLVVDRATGRLIGASAVGPRGGEVLGMLALAVHAELPLAELRSMIYAFPTFYGGVGEAVGAYGRGLATVLDPSYDGVAVLDEV